MKLADVVAMQALYYLQNKRPFDENLVSLMQDWIAESKAKYPIALIMQMFPEMSGHNYMNDYLDNYNYMSQTLHVIYNDIYTEEELHIFASYIALMMLHLHSFTAELKPYIESALVYTGERADAIHYLNELKYKYVHALIFSNDDDETRIFALLDELKDYTKNAGLISLDEAIDEVDQ